MLANYKINQGKNNSLKQARLLNFMGARFDYNSGRVYSKYTWRKRVIGRDQNKCQSCRGKIKDHYRKRQFSHEAHHIVQRCHGGKNTLENGVTLCKFCHQYFDYMYAKYNLDYHEVMAKFLIDTRLKQVRQLMKERYVGHLLIKIMYGKE